MLNRLIKSNNAGGGGCTDIVDNYDPFGGGGVALYQLNGDATDESGNYDGTASNVTYGTGVFGQAGVFNGSNSKITTVASQLPIPASGAFTVSFWAKVDSSMTQYNTCFMSFGDFWLKSEYPNGEFGLGDINTTERTTTSMGYGWNHCVLTVDASNNISLYLNGAEGFNGNKSISRTNGGNFAIGVARLNSPVYYFNGELDQVRIFNTALDPLEVEALYTEELCICDGTVDTLDILGDGSCIATYQLDGNANDLSGNYSGTPTNVSYGVGEFDLSGVFNGTSSQIIHSLNAVTNMSVSLWIYLTETLTNNTVYEFNNGYGLWFINNYGNQGKIGVQYANSNSSHKLSNSTIPLNQWVHIVGIHGSGTASLYVNNVSQNGGNMTDYLTCDQTTIGSRRTGEFFKGQIDQVRIFNKALNSTEVTTLYNETACTKAACTGTTNTLDILGDGSCIATYPLDGSPADLSGNYNGVQTNVTYPQGYFDLAGSFDGSGDTIDVASISGFPSGNSARTISFWMNSSSYLTGGILGYGVGASNQGFLFYVAGGNLHFTFYGNDVSTSYSLSANQWYHIVATHDGSTFTIYANGSSVNSAARTLNTSATNFRIGGASWNNGGEFFRGEIDQVRVFNKALSSGEVTTLYNETPCN